MSKQQTKTSAALSFDGFGGVDKTRGHSDTVCAEEMLNFRVRRDGSLQKRCGYRLLTDVGAPVRSYWIGRMDGEMCFFVATDQTLFSIDPASGEKTSIAPLPEQAERSLFFFYRDSLYLLNGKRFFRVTREGMEEIIGYVPLLTKDWDNRVVGEIYEPRNILTRKARLSYVISDPPSMFLLPPHGVKSLELEKVEINGEEIDPSRFEFDKNFETINVSKVLAGDRVMIYALFPEDYDDLFEQFCSCRYATTFGGPSSNRLFFWGGSAPTTMFSSTYLARDRLTEAQEIYPNCSPLYFPEGFEFTVGEGRHPVQGTQRHYDRLLIFTKGDTWIANEDSSGLDDFPTLGINSGIGCASAEGIALAENDPVTVGEYTVWQWSGETDRLSERNASRLSEAIDPLLSPEDYASAQLYYNRRERELWMNLPHRDEVWIYHTGHRAWYRFGGISADQFFDLETGVAFLRGSKIFVFDETLNVDCDADGEERPIEAYYLSTVSDFGTAENKNLCRLTVRGDLGGGTLSVTFSGDGTQPVRCELSDDSSAHSVIDRRVSSGSFRCGSVRISSSDGARPVIHSLTLRAR